MRLSFIVVAAAIVVIAAVVIVFAVCLPATASSLQSDWMWLALDLKRIKLLG